MQTRDGRAFDLLAPRSRDVDFNEIAHSLARIPRFLGHTRGAPYSVAQHSVLGARAVAAETRDTTLAAVFLLHDAHEAYLGDITTPVQQAIGTLYDKRQNAVSLLKHDLDRAVYGAAGILGLRDGFKTTIVDMDLRLCRAERDALMAPSDRPWHLSIETAAPIPWLKPDDFQPWPYDAAELAFRNSLQALMPHVLRKAAA